MTVAHGLAMVQNFIILFLVYFLVLGPLALALRILRRDLLAMRRDTRSTFYVAKDPLPTDLERCERQF